MYKLLVILFIIRLYARFNVFILINNGNNLEINKNE